MMVRILLQLCANTRMRCLVRVLRRRQLHNAGNNQWLPVTVPDRSHQIAVHLPDEFQRYSFGAYRLAFAMIRAASEEFIPHRGHHTHGPVVTLRLTLGERVQVSYFGRGEKHGRCIRAGGDAGSTADTCGCVKGSVCIFLWNQDRIGGRRASRRCADKASSLNDPVKS